MPHRIPDIIRRLESIETSHDSLPSLIEDLGRKLDDGQRRSEDRHRETNAVLVEVRRTFQADLERLHEKYDDLKKAHQTMATQQIEHGKLLLEHAKMLTEHSSQLHIAREQAREAMKSSSDLSYEWKAAAESMASHMKRGQDATATMVSEVANKVTTIETETLEQTALMRGFFGRAVKWWDRPGVKVLFFVAAFLGGAAWAALSKYLH